MNDIPGDAETGIYPSTLIVEATGPTTERAENEPASPDISGNASAAVGTTIQQNLSTFARLRIYINAVWSAYFWPKMYNMNDEQKRDDERYEMLCWNISKKIEKKESILKAAECGNAEEFARLYYADNKRINTQDSMGRSAVHYAAANNKTNILHFVRHINGDLNLVDVDGNTPLHLSIEEDALEALEALLKLGVDTTKLNKKVQAPIHLATQLNKSKIIHIMSKYKDKIDPNIKGKHGRTALHISAIYDYVECAKVLVYDFGSVLEDACNNGYYAVHEAAKNASFRTLEVFLQWGESRGCNGQTIMKQRDCEGNLPIHSAVHGGNIKAVELCLRSGAVISSQQQDESTPVHLACSQGALEVVKLMFSLQPEEITKCLRLCDVQKMRPIHCAAMFDHTEIVVYLLQEGSEMNAVDKEQRSPLLLAASRCCWRTVHFLIERGANLTITDVHSRNVLHLVVMNGGNLEAFASTIMTKMNEKILSILLNDKDLNGCSPLHYACRNGHVRSLYNLLRLGACINLKNNMNESPLHFAARYGRLYSASRLLESEHGNLIINESDGQGQTALHIASLEGHVKVVQLLLSKGALLHRDHNGRSPLHLAAMNGYSQTLRLLYSVHSHLLDQIDKDGNTPLHLAAIENKPNTITQLLNMSCLLLYNKNNMNAMDYVFHFKNTEAALAMVTHKTRACEVMSLSSVQNPCVTLALIASMPNVFAAVQDSCITRADCKKDSKSFYIKYDFRVLTSPRLTNDNHSVDGNNARHKQWQPMIGLNAMVNNGRVELLAHPLSQKYLKMKWNTYGKYFHLGNLLLYCVFLGFVTVYTYTLMYVKDPQHRNEDIMIKEMVATMTIGAVAIMTYISLCVVREMYNMIQLRWKYFFDKMNFVSWILYVNCIFMICPTFFEHCDSAQHSAAAFTVFFAWVHLLLLLQRFDKIGIYVVIFLEILQTLVKVLCVFSILIIAFGLAFYILMSSGNHLPFKTVPMSLMRSFTMMLGEIDYVGTYVEPLFGNNKDRSIDYPVASFVVLFLFMVLMPILLMNLLIGLAVGDIESVRRNAQLKRLAMQVVLHTELESKLPAFLISKVNKNEHIEYPNESQCGFNWFERFLRKWFFNPMHDERRADVYIPFSEERNAREIEKMKQDIKNVTSMIQNTYSLVRLMVQKMEIITEADDIDEWVQQEFVPLALRRTNIFPDNTRGVNE